MGGGFFGESHGNLAALAYFPARATFEKGPDLAFGQKPEVHRTTDMPFVLLSETLQTLLMLLGSCPVVN